MIRGGSGQLLNAVQRGLPELRRIRRNVNVVCALDVGDPSIESCLFKSEHASIGQSPKSGCRRTSRASRT